MDNGGVRLKARLKNQNISMRKPAINEQEPPVFRTNTGGSFVFYDAINAVSKLITV